MKKITTYLLLIALVFAFDSCKNKHKSKKSNMISVTIAPLKYLTEEIVGDHFKVKSILPGNTTAEGFQVQTQQMLQVSNSAVLFGIGSLGFEKVWLKTFERSLPDIKILTTRDGIEMIKNNGRPDMHIWMSPNNAKKIAKNIYNELIVIDKPNKDFYNIQLKKFNEKADSLDHYIMTKTKDLKNRNFAIYHPALTYYAKRYNLHQISIQQNNIEPTAKQLKSIINTIKSQKVKTLFIEKEFPLDRIRTIEEETGLKAIIIYPLNENWEQEMKNITDALCHE